MKQTFTLLSFLLVILFTNCAPKETFMFSNIPAGEGVKQKVQPATITEPVINAFPAESKKITERSTATSLVLTASTAPLALPQAAAFPKKVLPIDFKTNTFSKIPVSRLVVSPAKLLKLQKVIRKELKHRPEDGAKPVNKLARIGFILGLGALGLFILAGATQIGLFSLLALFASIGGLITSAIGLKEINRSPDQYAGKGKAIAGVVISAGILLLFLIAILLLVALVGSAV